MSYARLSMLRSTIIAAIATLAVMVDDGADAQTLTNPNPPAPSRPPLAAKPDTSSRVKSCSAYGAGYVNIPGTDACVKVGGSVTVGGSVNQGR
jgi:Porin subfamily